MSCESDGEENGQGGLKSGSVWFEWKLAIQDRRTIQSTQTYPDVKPDRATVGVEHKRMHLDTESGDVLLLEFTSQVSLDEGRFTGTTIANEHALNAIGMSKRVRDRPSISR